MVLKVFEKWDLHAVRIGEVVAGNDYIVKDSGKIVAQIPAKALADDGPVYVREEQKPDEAKALLMAFRFPFRN